MHVLPVRTTQSHAGESVVSIFHPNEIKICPVTCKLCSHNKALISFTKCGQTARNGQTICLHEQNVD